jgi:hypothetical protein
MRSDMSAIDVRVPQPHADAAINGHAEAALQSTRVEHGGLQIRE